VLFLLLFLTAFIGDLPYSVLAAMIMLPVFNLLDPGASKRLMRISRDDTAVAFVTFIVTLAFAPRLHKGLCGDGIDLYFSNVKEQVWDVLEGADFLNTIDKSISLPQTLLAFLNSSKATLAFYLYISECHKTTGSNVY